jgi:hypothetical protein
MNVFNRGAGNINIWNGIVQNAALVDAGAPANGHAAAANVPTLLPPSHPKHPNLLLRWQFFLQSVLTSDNQNKLADGIYNALLDTNVDYIVFDVVHKTAQDVVIAADTDDGDSIVRITIFTVPMRKHPKTHNGHDPDEIDT